MISSRPLAILPYSAHFIFVSNNAHAVGGLAHCSPRFHEPPRPPSSARRTVSDYTGSRSESSSCTNASPRSSSPNLLRPSFRFAGIDGTSEEERDGAFSTLDPPQADHKRRALTTGSTGPTRPLIRFADAEPLDNAMPNGHVQFIAPPCPSSRPSSRLNSRPGSRSRSSVSNTTAGATINSDSRAPIRPRRRTLQFTDTPHDRIEWHERESRAPQQQSSLSQWRLASLTGEDHQLTCARSHSAASSSIAGSGGGGPRSTMSSPWARSSSRAADRTTLSSPGADADANCVFMEGLESLAALEEKQVLQERRVAAWRRRAGSVESSDMVLGLGGGGATGVRSLRRQQSDWEALIREWEQPLEDESDYQAQTESLPSPTGLSSPRPPSIESDEKELSSSLSQSSRNRAQGVLDPLDPPDSLNSPNSLDSLDPLDPEKHGYLSTAAGKTPASRTLTPPQPLSLSRIRSAGTPPPPSHGPIAAQSGPNGPLFGGASQRKRHSHRRSWNVPSENDLDRADFGRARFRRHTHTLRRTTSVPPKFLSERLGRGLRVGAEMDTETDLDQCKFSRECSPPSTLSRDAPSAGAILRPPPSPAPHTLFSSANPKTECVSPPSSCLPIHSPPKQTQETGFVRSPSPIGSPHLTGLNLEECYGHDLSPDFRPHIHHRHYSRQESPRPYFQHQFQHQAQLHYQNQHLNQRPNLHQDQPPKPILRKNATLPAPTCLIPVSGEGEGREYPCSNFTGLPLPCSPHQVRTASLPRPHFRSHPTRQATIQLSSPFLLPQALRGPEHPSLSDENGASPGSSVSFSAHESSYASNNASDNASDNASNDASDDVSADESVSESSDALPRQAVSGSYQRGNVASWSPPLRSHRIVTPATLLSAAAGQKSMDVCGPEAGGGSYSGCGAGLKSDARTSRTMTLSRSPRPSRNFSPAQLSGRNTFAKHPLEVDMGGASAAPYLNAHPGPRSRSISRSSQVFSPSTGAVSPWTGMDSPLAAPAGCMSPSVAPGVLSPGGWSNGKGSHTLLPAESGLQSPPAFARPSVATTPVQVTGQVYSHPAH